VVAVVVETTAGGTVFGAEVVVGAAVVGVVGVTSATFFFAPLQPATAPVMSRTLNTTASHALTPGR
jgi:hypothetical protein